MRTRFGTGLAGNLSHISVVVYALIASDGFPGLCLRRHRQVRRRVLPLGPGDAGACPVPTCTRSSILGFTTAYLLLGGWYSVVLTDLVQFVLLTIASVFIAWLAMSQCQRRDAAGKVPEGWFDLLPPWQLAMDWSGLIRGLGHQDYGSPMEGGDGYSLFGIVIMMMLFRGFLVSMAGPRRATACSTSSPPASPRGGPGKLVDVDRAT